MPNPTVSTYTPDSLSAGDFPIVLDGVTIGATQVLSAGAVLGQVTASGEYILSLSAATDGSQTPAAILDADIDTTAGAAPGIVRLTGEVLGSQLTLGTGHTLASVKAALRPLSLFVR
ncbi:head decoration protein [Stutzerimonas degradans]|uniref:Head decoration protein n=1 Tax=Stutzerimonas degradans TaxID=2968968 RepID=A0A8E2QFW4_9GAMM|nr:head decoration protein [Stutzerimonas degradans]MCQ4274518.1 head decoration protein [Stutzerimonas degradans]PNF77947.1 head decoration protein [Stutzerimonas degradans]QPT23344.1 head decoration protein [Stutzerimonas degradans]